MIANEINGQDYIKLLRAGLQNLRLNADSVNNLNVFPIADGDTGDNMCSTLLGGLNATEESDAADIVTTVSKTAQGMFLGARGNSGVILSQFFSGVSEHIAKQGQATLSVISESFKQGVKKAYTAVSKPVEGTMLTVLREATEWACKRVDAHSTIISYIDDFIAEAKRSLEHTPDLLEVLRDAGVVDSGGAGVIHIFEGFSTQLHAVERGIETNQSPDVTVATTSKKLDFSNFDQYSEMKYGYCTEFMLQLQSAKTDVDAFNIDALTSSLSTIGESIVAFKAGSIVKVHIHTFIPGAVLNFCQQYGEYLTVKVENMTLQHNEVLLKKEKTNKYKRNNKHKRYAIVTVANGKGLHEIFTQLGADVVIEGGQGQNPSISDFVQAYEAVNADDIFVLPNNDNISLAAKQSVEYFTASHIHIVPTSTVGDGYSALSMLDLEKKDADDIVKTMISDIADSKTGLVSKATRRADLEGIHIEQGDYVGLCGKSLLTSTPNKNATAIDLLKQMGAEEKFFLVVFFGKDSTKQEQEMLSKDIAKCYPSLELYCMEGGQEVYDFVLILS